MGEKSSDVIREWPCEDEEVWEDQRLIYGGAFMEFIRENTKIIQFETIFILK